MHKICIHIFRNVLFIKYLYFISYFNILFSITDKLHSCYGLLKHLPYFRLVLKSGHLFLHIKIYKYKLISILIINVKKNQIATI